ncbi:MAG: replication initiation protein [Desulfamplus sp.]|nr:replication initiation protein [Desulfamplus sp.]
MHKKQLVKKANSLVESRCNLTLTQQKLVLAVISQIERDDEDFKEYSLSVSEFTRLMDIKSNKYYAEIRQSAEAIVTKKLLIYRGEKKELITTWFSSIDIDYEGEVKFMFDSKLKPYLLQLKSHFTAYQLKNILQLKSKYSIRLYELLKQYQNIGNRKFGIQELRDFLYVEEGKYTRFSDFKKRILETPKDDINAHTDIKISCTTKKTGRRVTSIEFTIERQSPQKEFFQTEENKPPQVIIDLIPQEHRKSCEKLCQQIFTKDGTDGLKFYIGKCNARKQTPNGSYSGYLKTIFDLDLYADVKESLEAQATAEKEIQKMKQQALEVQKKQKMQEQEQQATLKAKYEALERLQAENPDRYAKLEQQAADDLGLNLQKPGAGGKMRIKFKMFELMEKL